MLRGGDVKLQRQGQNGSECPTDPPVQPRKCPQPARRQGDTVPRATHFNTWLQVDAAFFSHFNSPKTAGVKQGMQHPPPAQTSAAWAPALRGPSQTRAVKLPSQRQAQEPPEAGWSLGRRWSGLTKEHQLDREQGRLAQVCPRLQRCSAIPEASFIVNLRRKETRTCLDLETPKVMGIAYFFSP